MKDTHPDPAPQRAARGRPASAGLGKVLLRLTLVVVIVAAAYQWSRPPRDPKYEGRELSAWMKDPSKGHLAFTRDGLTRDAFKAMGSDAITWVIWAAEHGRVSRPRDSLSEPSRIKLVVDQLWRMLLHRSADESYDERRAALEILEELGPEAAPALPVLVRLLGQTNSEYTVEVAKVLVGIGPSAVAQGFRTDAADGRSALIRAVAERMYLDSPPLTDIEAARFYDFLGKASKDPDPSVRVAAAHGLQKAPGEHFEPVSARRVIPVLIALLSDPQPAVRKAALEGLMLSAQESVSAAPRLREFLGDADAEVRENAAWLLEKIDRIERRAQAQLKEPINDAGQARTALDVER